MAETRTLSDGERETLESARDDLIKLPREEELKFYQRAKANDVLLGHNNTRYFQMVANGKHRKKRIFSLEHEGGKLKGSKTLKVISHSSTRSSSVLRRKIFFPCVIGQMTFPK